MNWSRIACIALVVGLMAAPSKSQQVRYDSARDWRQWQLPIGAVDLLPEGTIVPTRIRKSPDAVRDLDRFGGGIRKAGSNLQQAENIIDGDLSQPAGLPTQMMIRASGLLRSI